MPISNRWRPALTGTWCAAFLVVAIATTVAEPLYMPRAVKNAYTHGTRSPDGRPGPNYWQNHGRYTIDLTANPPLPQITGSERITYFNNSPDSLRSLVFKLLLNIHKPGAPRDGGAGPDYLTSGVHIDSFSVNGKPATWPGQNAFTSQQVTLPARLLPHDSVNLAIAWHYDLSKESGREGMIDSTTYFLAYFYPRVAVYDDYDGWDRMAFTDQQEFYSDFNDYDVTIRAPKNYVVWGTGTLTNAAEVLSPTAAQRLQGALASDQTVHIATLAELNGGQVTRQDAMNAWHFTATNVPDMTFNLSNHYVWDAAGVTVDDATKRRVSVQAAYNDTAQDYHYMVQFGRHALDWLSHHWPGVPYPYEKTTVVQGFADMEYPMMVNDGSTNDTTFSRFVVEHEIAHSWFPFYMGINETRYGFMDEGWATTFEYLINLDDMGVDRASTFYKQFRVNGWIRDPSPLEDLPIITPEDVLKNQAYGNNAYGKASLGYLAVKDLLGDEVFGKSLREFIIRWHGKHPIPWDFFNTMNNASGKDLNWFWRNWFFSNNYIDLAVTGVVKAGTGYTVTVHNIGGMAAPVNFVIKYSDGSADTLHQTPAIWAADQVDAKVSVPTRKTIQSVTLDGGIWMDADTTNNTLTVGR